MGFDYTRIQKKFEEFAYVLDFLPRGKMSRGAFKAEPIVQLIGESYFTLLEASVVRNLTLNLGERIYIGKDLSREKVSHIIGRISYETLTAVARNELSSILEEIVNKQEGRFVDFFNNTSAITPRMHSLELLPGIGKKYMWNILRAREQKPFTSFHDMMSRTEITDPAKLIIKRVIEELSEDPKYRLFTRSM